MAKTSHEIFLNIDNVTDTKGKISEFYDESKPSKIGYVSQFGVFSEPVVPSIFLIITFMNTSILKIKRETIERRFVFSNTAFEQAWCNYWMNELEEIGSENILLTIYDFNLFYQ